MGVLENLDKKFDLVVPEEETKQIAPAVSGQNEDIEDDAEFARQTLRDLIADATSAVTGIKNIADVSESARAYEVTGMLIKTAAELAKDLLEIQKRKKDLAKDEKPLQQIGSQTINVFSGSTQDLLKAIAAKVEEEAAPLLEAEIVEEEDE